MNKNAKKKKKGFTLIELIIVLAIMAIIAAIAIPNFAAVRDNSKKKADTQSCETIKRTVLMLVSDESVPTPASDTNYPVTFTSGVLQDITGDTTDKKIKTALSEVKPPQEAGKTGYQITIKSNGDVFVVPTPVPVTP